MDSSRQADGVAVPKTSLEKAITSLADIAENGLPIGKDARLVADITDLNHGDYKAKPAAIIGNEQGNPMPLGLGGIARHAVVVPKFCNEYTCAHITDLVYCSRRPRQGRVRHCNQRTIEC